MTWTVFNCLLARITPLGHFASWQGSSTPNLYWISSTLGFPGLDFFQALLAGALAQLLAAATAAVEPKHPQVSLMEDEDSEHRPLLSHVVGNNSIQVTRAAALRARRPALLALGLVALSSLPPSHIQYSTSTYRVGCALPQDRHQDTAGYLHESRVSASRGARIVLWPETAVYLSNEKELHALESQLFDISKTYGCHIGATYALKKDNKMENSFALIGPESATALVTYSKRHLLPLVESFPTRQGREAAPTYNFDVPLLSFCKSHVHDKGSISVVPQICHDTSFPVWTEQTPSLMLVPVNVPEVSIGEARLDELKERSRETNSAVLFCDASPRGVSGLLDQRGWVRALQVRSVLLPRRNRVRLIRVPPSLAVKAPLKRMCPFKRTLAVHLCMPDWEIKALWLPCWSASSLSDSSASILSRAWWTAPRTLQLKVTACCNTMWSLREMFCRSRGSQINRGRQRATGLSLMLRVYSACLQLKCMRSRISCRMLSIALTSHRPPTNPTVKPKVPSTPAPLDNKGQIQLRYCRG